MSVSSLMLVTALQTAQTRSLLSAVEWDFASLQACWGVRASAAGQKPGIAASALLSRGGGAVKQIYV